MNLYFINRNHNVVHDTIMMPFLAITSSSDCVISTSIAAQRHLCYCCYDYFARGALAIYCTKHLKGQRTSSQLAKEITDAFAEVINSILLAV